MNLEISNICPLLDALDNVSSSGFIALGTKVIHPPADFLDILLAEGDFHPREKRVLANFIAHLLGIIAVWRSKKNVKVI